MYLPTGKKFITENLQSVFASSHHPSIQFEVTTKGDEYILNARILINDELLKPSDNQWDNILLFLYDEEIFIWKRAEDALIAEKFNKTLKFQRMNGLLF